MALAAGTAHVLSVRPGRASVARALSLKELVTTSQHALVGVPLDHFSQWEVLGGQRRVVTYTMVRVQRPLDGRTPPSPDVLVRTLGGVVDDIGQVVPGEAVLVHKQAAALFLTGAERDVFAVTGQSQGHYRVVVDAGIRRFRATARSLELVGASAASAVVRLHGRTIPEVEALVAAELSSAD